MRWLLSLVLLFDVNVVFAREIFIGPSGSNSSGTGSMAAPYQTLLHVLEPANGIVQAGDVITLRGSATGTVYAANEYRLRTRLTVRSFPGEWAILRCPINVPDGICLQIDPEASGSVISRLEIEGGTV